MKRFVSLFLFPALLLLAGCDLLNGSDSESDSSGTITAADLVGTWEQKTYYDSEHLSYYETQYTFYDDGTYVVLEDDCDEGGHDYYASKGTYSLDAEGNLTMTEQYFAYPESFDVPATDDWTLVDHPETTTGPVLLIGNQLYFDFMIAQGNVSDIVGEWISQWSEYGWDGTENKYETTYYKDVCKFNSDDTYEYAEYESNTEAFDPPPDTTETGTYIYADGTLTITPANVDPEELPPPPIKGTIYNNSYLIIGDETSAKAYAFLKQ